MSEKKKKWLENIIVFSVILGSLLLYFSYVGYIKSGFHFMDDEGVFEWTNEFYVPYGFFRGFWNQLLDDIYSSGRFRYTWVLIRWTQIHIFGDNFILWHIYQVVFDSLTLFSIYIFIKKLKINRLFFLVFSFLLYFGYQATILWMLGPQENIGVFFVTLSLISWLNYDNKRSKINLFFLFISLFFLAGSKESFLILFPMLPFLFCYMSRRNNESVNLKTFLLKEYKIIIYIYIIFLLCILRIITNSAGESGTLNSGLVLNEVIKNLINNITLHLISYAASGFLAGVMIFIYILKKDKNRIGKYLMLLVMIFYVLSSQLFIHIDKGMSYRYLVPFTYFFALFFILVWNDILKHHRAIIITAVLVCGIVAYGNRGAVRFARVFADDGYCINRMFNIIEKNAKDGDRILFLMDLEGSYAADLYLQNSLDDLDIEYIEREKLKASDVDIIWLSTGIEEYSYIQDEINISDKWEIYKDGVYIVYIKK